jgi:hypothetical protein
MDDLIYGFITPLISEYIKDDTWYLHEPLVFRSKTLLPGKTFIMPAGFYTDFASVPKIFRNIISKYGRHAKSAVLHDYLYYCGFLGCRSLCDDLFNEAMIHEEERGWMRIIVYWMVKMFSGFAWNGHRKRNHSEEELKIRLANRTIHDVRKELEQWPARKKAKRKKANDMAKKSKWDEFTDYLTQFGSQSWDWRFRNVVNLIDDPVDDLKHKINGMQILGMTFYLPSWLMKNSGDDSK